MKRFLNVVLSLCLVVSLFIVGTPVTEAKEKIKEYKVMAIKEAPQKGGSIDVEKLKGTTISISNLDLDNNNIIKGNVKVDDQMKSFDLVGSLYKGKTGDIIYGDLSDNLNNFEVVRFEVLKEAENKYIVNKKQKGPMLVLYLSEKNKRNLILAEIPLGKLLSSKDVNMFFNNAKSYQEVSPRVVLWMTEYFKPDATFEGEANFFQLSSITTSSFYRSYTMSYNWFGSTATDTLTLNFTYTKPSGTSEDVKGKVRIAGNQIEHNDEVYVVTSGDTTNWKVENIEFKLETEEPEVITWLNIDAIGTQSGTIKVGLSYSYSYNGFGAGFSYVPEKEVDLNNGGTNIDNTRGAKFITKDGFSLKDYQTHYAVAAWDIACSGTSCSDNPDSLNKVTISFDLYNVRNLESYGRRSHSHSFYVSQQ